MLLNLIILFQSFIKCLKLIFIHVIYRSLIHQYHESQNSSFLQEFIHLIYLHRYILIKKHV
jgi:hypothetical protein